MRSRRRQLQVRRPQRMCVYCGIRSAQKREHVIAKVFWQDRQLPSNVVTVPSCHQCDSGTGDGGTAALHHDEEYMRNILCIREEAEHPVAVALRDSKVMRSYQNSPGMLKSLVSTTRMVTVRSSAGIYLPTPRPSFVADLNRIRRVVRKIVRGLYFAKKGSPLPPDIVIDVLPDVSGEDCLSYLKLFREPPNEWQGYGDRDGHGVANGLLRVFRSSGGNEAAATSARWTGGRTCSKPD